MIHKKQYRYSISAAFCFSFLVVLINSARNETTGTPVSSSKYNKVFNLGFPKSGSSTLHEYFQCHNKTSYHWSYGTKGFYKAEYRSLLVGLCINDAAEKNQSLAEATRPGCNKSFDVLMQMDAAEDFVCSMPQVQYLHWFDMFYPKSKFIYPYRLVDDWYSSVLVWGRNLELRLLNCVSAVLPRGAPQLSSFGNSTETILKNFYSWHFHQVLDYFKDRPEDLIIIDLYSPINNEVLDFALGYSTSKSAGRCFGHSNENHEKSSIRGRAR